jgi:hypothetical protein
LVALIVGFLLGKLLTPRRVKVVTVSPPATEARLEEPSHPIEARPLDQPVRNDRREVARLLLPLAVGIGRAWLDRRLKRKSKE